MRRRLLAALASAVVLAGVAVSAALDTPGSKPRAMKASSAALQSEIRCDRFAAPGGDDRSRGTKARPFRTAQRLADSLRAGKTGCLRSGVYDEADERFVLRLEHGGAKGRRLTIRSFPGERARLVGIVSVEPEADYVTLAHLAIEGTGDQNTVKIYAADTVVRDNDITNASRGKSCMIIGSDSSDGQSVRPSIRHNRFHDCGSSEHDNKDHAIYAQNAADGRIVGNVFWGTSGYSIHLYPNARRMRIAHNVVDGGPPSIRGGVLLAGNSEYASSENVIEFNVIAYAATYNITSNWDDGRIGTGNIVRSNCVWQGKDGNIDSSNGGFTARSNRAAPPRFVDRQRHDYRLKRGSRCRRVVGLKAR